MIAPAMPNRTTKPSDTTAPTARPRPTAAAGLGSSPSLPTKNDRYAGNMAKPHGVTGAPMPGVNARASGASTTSAQLRVDQVLQLRLGQRAEVAGDDLAVGV